MNLGISQNRLKIVYYFVSTGFIVLVNSFSIDIIIDIISLTGQSFNWLMKEAGLKLKNLNWVSYLGTTP